MSLYPTQSLCQSEDFQTVDELIDILRNFKTAGVNNIDLVAYEGGKVVNISDACFTAELLEKTLSDGSKVHDIQLTFRELEI